MNRGGDIDFSSEDLGLAPVAGDLETDEFDAFNDDTFGAEDVWVEDDHEEVRIKNVEGHKVKLGFEAHLFVHKK